MMKFWMPFYGIVMGLVSLSTAAPEQLQKLSSEQLHQPKTTVEDVHFLLWTRSNPGEGEEYEVLYKDATSLINSPLTPSDPTVVLIHGFGGCCYWPIDAKDELLKLGSYNVIVVNWDALSAAPWYNTAYQSVPLVGERTARFLEWVHEESGLDISELRVVGHSLGAHLSGFIGKHLNNFRLPHITGLDPAGPGFHNVSSSDRLHFTDADYVMIMHTNAGHINHGCVGMETQIGHVDFFPNGGDHQPGCTVGGDMIDLLLGGCSHGRSHEMWIESINGGIPFTSRPCQDWMTFDTDGCPTCGQGCLNMGFHTDISLGGNYYLYTNRNTPFAQG